MSDVTQASFANGFDASARNDYEALWEGLLFLDELCAGFCQRREAIGSYTTHIPSDGLTSTVAAVRETIAFVEQLEAARIDQHNSNQRVQDNG